MKNKLYYGDNLEVLRQNMADESVDLCYIDPPFNSKRNYNQIYNNIGQEDTAQAQAFVDTWTWNSMANEGFEDIVSNKNGLFTAQSIYLIIGFEKILGKGSLLAYLVSMTQRIAEIYRILKPTGSLYLHCDPTASHYLKLVCDGLFIKRGGVFRNEIIWCYNTGGRGKDFFPRKHDVIFWYNKSKKYIFQYEAVALERDTSTMHEPIKNDEEGRPYQRNFKNGKEYKYYLDKGVLPNDWWTDIQAINPSARERLGYPTQKPEKLLERIIKASSNEGDTILDCYCGCGTTIAVAEKLGRKWIGIDITYQSISLILKRLEDSFGLDFTQNTIDKDTNKVILPARLELAGVPQDFESAVALANRQDDRVRKEFEKWAVLTYSNNRAVINDKKGGDGGIDAMAFVIDYDQKGDQVFKEVIFSVKSSKNLSPSVIRDLYGTVERENAVAGYLITLYPMPNLVKEAQKYGNFHNKMFGQNYPKIVVISIDEILEGKRMNLPTGEVLKKAELKIQSSKGMFDN